MVAVLDTLLATLAVVESNVKARHWTLIGSKFKSWHLEFDDIADAVREAKDMVAEIIIQLGDIPVYNFEGFIQKSLVPNIATLSDWRRMVEATGAELAAIIKFINENNHIFDAATSNDVAAIAAKLRHYYMFCAQTIKETYKPE